MKIIGLFLSLLPLIISSCSTEYSCSDTSITPVFINFQPSDIDTLVLRKYAVNSNFTNPLDSEQINFGYSGYYISNNDSTTVQLFSEKLSIKTGFDWQIFIPSKNRTINISQIKSEKRIDKCSHGIFSMDKVACDCTNRIFSCSQDTQPVSFTNFPYNIYITN